MSYQGHPNQTPPDMGGWVTCLKCDAPHEADDTCPNDCLVGPITLVACRCGDDLEHSTVETIEQACDEAERLAERYGGQYFHLEAYRDDYLDYCTETGVSDGLDDDERDSIMESTW